MKATERAEAAVECSCGVNATLRGEHWRKCPVTRVAAALEEVRDEALEEAALKCEEHSQAWDRDLDRIYWSMRSNPIGPPGMRDWEHGLGRKHEAARLAAEIRTLKTPRKEPA